MMLTLLLTIAVTAPIEKPPGEIWVMVVDTGIGKHFMLKPYIPYDDTADYVDTHIHGTHVAGIIAYGNQKLNDPVCNKVKIFSCKYYDSKRSGGLNVDASAECIRRAVRMKMDYINYSGSGEVGDREEYDALNAFGKQGGITFAAAGQHSSMNAGHDLKEYPEYPAAYAHPSKIWSPFKFRYMNYKALKSVRIVEASCGDKICPWSNFREGSLREIGSTIWSTAPNDTYLGMHGTSQATPMALHKVLKQRCKELGFQRRNY